MEVIKIPSSFTPCPEPPFTPATALLLTAKIIVGQVNLYSLCAFFDFLLHNVFSIGFLKIID